MDSILSIQNLNKVYASKFQALKNINLEIRRGEIFALLGPNGAGKTTLINSVCGIVNPTSGRILVDGHDNIKDFRQTRTLIGLVPQELAVEMFENIWHTVNFSRGLFGKAPDVKFVENVIKQLSLWDKKDSKIQTLSGGMKRRVMIAKALSHEPRILFLDEPTAGVDVNLRKDMWEQVRALKKSGVTIILTTHYIEEAEEMADRIGVINRGEIIVVDDKKELMKKLGRKQLILDLKAPVAAVPTGFSESLTLNADKTQLIYTYDTVKGDSGIAELLAALSSKGIAYRDIHTETSSLEDIFIQLVKDK
ncbi:MAG: ABC transporter ATP-binding protein [Candidatus Omnitrophica bacterium]|nr:ABC transporter ATP-binding protein [Candidatus Omnitrophota bacterium]